MAAVATDNPRDRQLVTWAGVLPDADGLGAVVDVVAALSSGKECTFHYYQQYHHLLLHGWPGGDCGFGGSRTIGPATLARIAAVFGDVSSASVVRSVGIARPNCG